MKTVKALSGIFLLVAVLYVIWAIVPHYFNNYRFEDAIEQEARLNAYTGKSERDMRESLYKKARDLGLPLQAEQIQVLRQGGEIQIWAEYTVVVNLPGYQVVLNFRPSTSSRRI